MTSRHWYLVFSTPRGILRYAGSITQANRAVLERKRSLTLHVWCCPNSA